MKYLYLILLSLFFFSCLENDISFVPPLIQFGTSELLLREFESNGDFINSKDNPAIIEAEEIHNNIDNYLIVDIRPYDDYNRGRIPNAINVKSDSLVEYLDGINWQVYPKIIIVSSTGQHAAFCTSILRLLNYNNVYSMNFGMAMWNSYFSDEWRNALNEDVFWFNNISFPKPKKTALPKLPNIRSEDISETLLERAKQLLQTEYDELCIDNIEKELTISYETIDYKYYTVKTDSRGKKYKDLDDNVTFICYSNYHLYFLNNYNTSPQKPLLSHPNESILYYSTDENESDIESGKFLQTIPNNKTVFIYSYSGQRSAFLTAYLRMLGYSAKSMVFGACSFAYYSMLENTVVVNYTFQSLKTNNFEYDSGL